MNACLYACMFECMSVCMYALMNECMHICMYACMYLSGYVSICQYMNTPPHILRVSFNQHPNQSLGCLTGPLSISHPQLSSPGTFTRAFELSPRQVTNPISSCDVSRTPYPDTRLTTFEIHQSLFYTLRVRGVITERRNTTSQQCPKTKKSTLHPIPSSTLANSPNHTQIQRQHCTQILSPSNQVFYPISHYTITNL